MRRISQAIGDYLLRRDPWSGQEKKPPELDKLIAEFLNKLRNKARLQPKHSSDFSFSALFAAALALCFVLWLGLGFFIVKPAEQAVILRFGRYVETVMPGPHWLPLGIESYTKINVQQVNSFSLGADYLTQSSTEDDKKLPDSGVSVDQDRGDDDTDKNVVYAELNVQYRIVDPKEYLFNIQGAELTLEQAAGAALSEVIGAMRLNEVLTTGRDQLTWLVKERLQSMINAYQAGINVVSVNVRKIQAPEEVADAFLDVVQAGQDEQRYIQQAQAYARKVIPIAEGNKNRILAQARAYQQEVMLNSEADVSRYLAILRVYQNAPTITKDRLYLETMETVLSQTSKILLDTPKQMNLVNLPVDRFLSLSKHLESAGSVAPESNSLTEK